ncbi:peroxide stress protein YaaA [Tessaracoccus caeni]|uniref:peroxide stress protein YaaA n=1 Tax=Tessaracoccus caeni TaxID=3031239 RepID=UPI0023DB5959|nr:peroxide stress protein YaaA [Tessaracoccus caeni]MDF1487336.1 peroxide stress protein YaaA [Tessaracoccus caeni]
MLVVLSPAKSLDFETRVPTPKHSQPRLLDGSQQLIEVMAEKSPEEIKALMGISDDLAHLNATRYRSFNPEHTRRNSRQAVFAFNGDVYQGLDARSLDARDLTEAGKTVRILSGLYGLLRPLDLIQPHRLEMGTRLVTPRGKNLYEWWGETITDLLKEDLTVSPGPEVLVNLASTEYFTAVRTERLGVPVVTPRFEDRGPDGVPRVVSFHAKRARGTMAAWLVRNRVRSVSKIRAFDGGGYTLDEARSTRWNPVFVR